MSICMNETKKETLKIACEYWELSMLEIMYNQKMISEEEYRGITEIVKKIILLKFNR